MLLWYKNIIFTSFGYMNLNLLLPSPESILGDTLVRINDTIS